MNRFLYLMTVVAVLTACSSGVILDEVPVEDRTATPVATVTTPPGGGTAVAPGAGAGSGTSQASAGNRPPVAPVDLNKPGTAVATHPTANVVYFDYDSYIVKLEFASVIEGHARYLKLDRNRKVAIEGHTDERGGREYNLALGQRRAEAVKQALALLGVPDPQVEAVSFGKEKPAATGASDAALAQNRRAEIVYR